MPTSGFSFFVHKGQERSPVIEDVVTRCTQTISRSRIGASLFIPRGRDTYNYNASRSWRRAASYIIADLECDRLALPFAKRGVGREDYTYLSDASLSGDRDVFVRDALDAQRMAGASVLVSPWFVHGRSQTNDEIDLSIDLAGRALRQAQQQPLLYGLYATADVIANDRARKDMLNRIVTQLPENPIYFRMSVPTPEGRRQFERVDAIRGLRMFVTALRKNNFPTVLPQSGLLGWTMLGFGATAFGAGMAGSLQRSEPKRPDQTGGPTRRLSWYFVPQLLGFLQLSEVSLIRRLPGFADCTCPWCGGATPRPGPTFEHTAGMHFLWWCSQLATELNNSGAPGLTVRRRLASAEQYWQQIRRSGVVLDARSQQTHLGAWLAATQGP